MASANLGGATTTPAGAGAGAGASAAASASTPAFDSQQDEYVMSMPILSFGCFVNATRQATHTCSCSFFFPFSLA